MLLKKYGLFFFLIWSFIGCQSEDDSGKNTKQKENKPAQISFYNESSFKVDVYKNLNPEHFDPTALAGSIEPGETKKITVYPSEDQKIGDTFYPRYKILLAETLKTGTLPVYVDAQRDLSNISLVVEEGKTYTKTIPQPLKGQLKFINGYIEIQNTGSAQVQILKGNDVLYTLDNKSAYLNTGQHLGYYEIPFTVFDDTLTVQLKAFSKSYIAFPAITMERGKIYSFTCNDSTVTKTGERNISPLP